MLRDKRGMTLVEVIVTLVLMMLFIGCAIAVIVPVLNVYNRTIAMADDQSVAVNLAETIAHKVYYGKNINISEDNKTLVIDGVQFTTQNGYLKEGDYLVYDPGYYNLATCDISFAYENNIVTIVITIIRENRDNYVYELKAKPLLYISEESPGNDYDIGDLAFEDSNGRKLYVSGNWAEAKQAAIDSIRNGIDLTPGIVYKDHTGVYVVLWTNWLSREQGIADISLADYIVETNQKINTNANILTEADYEYSSYYGQFIWINPPVKGSLFLKDGILYACGTPGGMWTTIDFSSDDWVKIIQY